MHQATQEQWTELIAAIDRKDARLASDMPTEHDALAVMFSAWERLKQLGWREAIYCPKDGTVFDAIEPGSTGIHDCIYQGDWPKGSWWVLDAGDMWPSRPALFRLKPTPASDDVGSAYPNSERTK